MNRGDEDYLSLGIPEKLLGEGSEELQEELRKYDVTTAGELVHLPEGVHIGGKDYSGWYLCLDGKNGYMDAANVYLFLKPGEKNLLVRTSLRTVRNPVTGTAKDQKVLLKEYVPAEELYDELRDIYPEQEPEPEDDAEKTTVLVPSEEDEVQPSEEDAGEAQDALESESSQEPEEKATDSGKQDSSENIDLDVADDVLDPEEDDEPYIDLEEQTPAETEQEQPVAAEVPPAEESFRCGRAPLCGYYDIQIEGEAAERFLENAAGPTAESGEAEMLDRDGFRKMLGSGMAYAMARRMAEAAKEAR